MRHRSSRHLLLARVFLTWFALTLGAAFAAPVVHLADWQAQLALQAVCTSDGGTRDLLTDAAGHGDHDQAAHDHQMHCPLCLTLKEPPSVEFNASAIAPSPLAHALTPLVSARIEALVGAPLPPRGPPHIPA